MKNSKKSLEVLGVKKLDALQQSSIKGGVKDKLGGGACSGVCMSCSC